MARSMRKCLTLKPQGGTDETETNPSVPEQEVHRDTREGKVITDYNPDVDYKPEWSDPDIKAAMKRKTLMQNTSRWNIASEDNEPQGHRMDRAGIKGMRT